MTRRNAKRGLPNWIVGLICVLVLAVLSVYAFTKSVPWASSYEIKAAFTSATNVRVKAPVRIAGVDVGEVTAVEHVAGEDSEGGPSTAAIVTMKITDEGRPIKEDANFQLRPRLFLEGNLFVDVNPGSPSAAEVPEGYEFPVDQTATSVQIDQLFSTLQSDVREQLQVALHEFGSALVDHGGAKGFRELYRTAGPAGKFTSQVNEAFLGTEPHDLSGLIRNLGDVVEALGRNEETLQSLVTNFRIFAGSFAAEAENLEQAVATLPGVLDAADPAFAALNAAFPPLRTFSREALPGVESTPEALDAALPLIEQLRLLVSEDELRGLVSDLRPTIPSLARLARETLPFLEETRALSSCFNEVVIPWSELSVNDPINPASGNVYQETGYGLVGISGESRSGDANGQSIKVGAGGGTNTFITPPVDGQPGQAGMANLLGAIPTITENFGGDSRKTKFRPNQPCEEQDIPNLAATLSGPPEQMATPDDSIFDASNALTGELLGQLAQAQLEAEGAETSAEAKEASEAVADALSAWSEFTDDYTDKFLSEDFINGDLG